MFSGMLTRAACFIGELTNPSTAINEQHSDQPMVKNSATGGDQLGVSVEPLRESSEAPVA